MIVNQIHLVSTPLDLDYKNVYDGVANKREMRSFLLGNFDNIYVANSTTSTSIRFEKDLTITLNVPFTNQGIDVTYESLRKYNYMIITAKRNKSESSTYYDTFFYFVTDFTVENSIANNNMPSGLTTKFGGYFTTTFTLKWDVWNNNIEDINDSKYYEQFFIRKHIDDFKISRDNSGLRYDGRNTYENLSDNLDVYYRLNGKTMYNRKPKTIVFLRVFVDGALMPDYLATVDSEYYQTDNAYYFRTRGMLPEMYEAIENSNVVSGLKEFYIPIKILDTKTRNDITRYETIELVNTNFSKQVNFFYYCDENKVINELKKLGNVFKFGYSTVQFFNYQYVDDKLRINRNYFNFYTLTKNYGIFDETNILMLSPTKSYLTSFNSIQMGEQVRDTDSGYFIRNVPSVETKSIGTKMNLEPNLHYYPYECQGIMVGNKFIPLNPSYNENFVRIVEDGIGKNSLMYKIVKNDFDNNKPFSILEKTSFLPFAEDLYISEYVNKAGYIQTRDTNTFFRSIANSINFFNPLGTVTDIFKKHLVNTMDKAERMISAEFLGSGNADVSSSSIDDNFCFDDIVFVDRKFKNSNQKEAIYRQLELYGISYNRIGNFENTRMNFDYQQTSDCSLTMVKDLIDRKELENLFNNGIRKWHIDTGYLPAIIAFDNEYINLQITLD